MALSVTGTEGRVQLNGQDVNGTVQSSSGGDYVSLFEFSAAVISDGDAVAAVVSTGASASPPNVVHYTPPTYSFYQVYYNQSYRWQVNCGGGSIGIRI